MFKGLKRPPEADIAQALAAFDQLARPMRPQVSDVEVAAKLGWLRNRALLALMANADDGVLSWHDVPRGQPPEAWFKRVEARVR